MSTAHLPPERRSEIARNAAIARNSPKFKHAGKPRGKAPCHSPADPDCRTCRLRENNQRWRAAKKAAEVTK